MSFRNGNAVKGLAENFEAKPVKGTPIGKKPMPQKPVKAQRRCAIFATSEPDSVHRATRTGSSSKRGLAPTAFGPTGRNMGEATNALFNLQEQNDVRAWLHKTRRGSKHGNELIEQMDTMIDEIDEIVKDSMNVMDRCMGLKRNASQLITSVGLIMELDEGGDTFTEQRLPTLPPLPWEKEEPVNEPDEETASTLSNDYKKSPSGVTEW